MIETIYIAAGCFWGVEAYYKQIKGVLRTETGYANGPTAQTTYEQVCSGSGHVEVVKVAFDKTMLAPEELFDSYIRIIDPQSRYKQGGDLGVQYRIGLYTVTNALLAELQTVLKRWESANFPTVIELLPLQNYTRAEQNHQDYITSNPGGYCHVNLASIPHHLRK